MSERIVLIVLDSTGVGELPDAVSYNDAEKDVIENIFYKAEKIFFSVEHE
jgi:phosphopentomutase